MKYKKYPSYKDSGVEWLGDIPENWKLRAQLVFGSVEAPAADKAFMNEFKNDFLASIEEIKELIGKVENRLYEHSHEKK